MKNLILFLMILFLLVIFGVFFLKLKNDSGRSEENGVVCTMDAMQCPDGSYVGRIPPNCEFAPCP